jgi:16S rRNA (guanine(1405)-N(7))-methyltransferase
VKEHSLLEALQKSKTYGALEPGLLRRVAEAEFGKGRRRHKDALKAAKRVLHQIYGAFQRSSDFDRLFGGLQAAYSGGDRAGIQAALGAAMQAHASTSERLPHLESFYREVFARTGVPERLLDLGCGLNPLSALYLGWPREMAYTALDIGAREVEFLNRSFALFGFERAAARAADLLFEPPVQEADLALLLKVVPTLELQRKGASRMLLESLRAAHVVVSFTTVNLGAVPREKGMRAFYKDMFCDMIAGKTWRVEELDFKNELVFIVSK